MISWWTNLKVTLIAVLYIELFNSFFRLLMLTVLLQISVPQKQLPAELKPVHNETAYSFDVPLKTHFIRADYEVNVFGIMPSHLTMCGDVERLFLWHMLPYIYWFLAWIGLTVFLHDLSVHGSFCMIERVLTFISLHSPWLIWFYSYSFRYPEHLDSDITIIHVPHFLCMCLKLVFVVLGWVLAAKNSLESCKQVGLEIPMWLLHPTVEGISLWCWIEVLARNSTELLTGKSREICVTTASQGRRDIIRVNIEKQNGILR